MCHDWCGIGECVNGLWCRQHVFMCVCQNYSNAATADTPSLFLSLSRVPLHLTLHCGNSLIKFQRYGAEVIGNLLLLARHHQECRLFCTLSAFLHSPSQIVSGWNVSRMHWSQSSRPAHILTWTRWKRRNTIVYKQSLNTTNQASLNINDMLYFS